MHLDLCLLQWEQIKSQPASKIVIPATAASALEFEDLCIDDNFKDVNLIKLHNPDEAEQKPKRRRVFTSFGEKTISNRVSRALNKKYCKVSF